MKKEKEKVQEEQDVGKQDYIPYKGYIHQIDLPEYEDQETGIKVPKDVLVLNNPSYIGYRGEDPNKNQDLYESRITYMIETKTFHEYLAKSKESAISSKHISTLHNGKSFTMVTFAIVHEEPFIASVVIGYTSKELLKYILKETKDFKDEAVDKILENAFPLLREVD